MNRRTDCDGPISTVHVTLTRQFFFSTSQSLRKQMIRYFLTGALDHAQCLHKSHLLPRPVCTHCNQDYETAKHPFWECRAWQSIRSNHPVLMKLFSLCGTFWPNNLLHCGWILDHFPYGFHLLPALDIHYNLDSFARDIHFMYLDILIQRYQASHVSRQVAVTPIQRHFSSCISISTSPSDQDSPIVLDVP